MHMCSEKLFCVVTLLFETRVGTVNPSAVVRGLKRAALTQIFPTICRFLESND
jgi:hypothetical protein